MRGFFYQGRDLLQPHIYTSAALLSVEVVLAHARVAASSAVVGRHHPFHGEVAPTFFT